MTEDTVNWASERWKEEGTVILEADQCPLNAEEWACLDECSFPERVSYENVLVGDADEPNYVRVARFMTDVHEPCIVNPEVSERIVGILGSPKMMSLYRRVLGRDKVTIRRCQVNLYGAGSFVGRHLDVDSNPDYISPVVLQFRSGYEGGEYVVYHESKGPLRYCLGERSMLISRCDLAHEVTPVTRGVRKAMVFFLGPDGGKNRRPTYFAEVPA